MSFRRATLMMVSLIAPYAFAAPPIGHPSAEQAINLLGVPADGKSSALELPYAGTVISARDSNAFTFIEVKIDGPIDTSRWIAAPRTALIAGDRIRFDDGRLMNNFYSRKHDITFASITFVNRVIQAGSEKP